MNNELVRFIDEQFGDEVKRINEEELALQKSRQDVKSRLLGGIKRSIEILELL